MYRDVPTLAQAHAFAVLYLFRSLKHNTWPIIHCAFDYSLSRLEGQNEGTRTPSYSFVYNPSRRCLAISPETSEIVVELSLTQPTTHT